MKKILSLLLLSSSVLPMQLAYKLPVANKINHAINNIIIKSSETRVEPSSIRTSRELRGAELYHNNKGFIVKKDGERQVVEKRFMDSLARDMTKEQLKQFIKCGFFKLEKANDGSLVLKANDRLPGGGIIGSCIGAFAGKMVVSIVCHGAIAIVGVATFAATGNPVVAFGVVKGLESTFGVAIEGYSIKAAIAGGIAGGVVTGPV